MRQLSAGVIRSATRFGPHGLPSRLACERSCQSPLVADHLDQGVLHVSRVKGSKDSTHSFDRDELRDLRKLRQAVTGLYVFETERGGPMSVDALQYIVREAGKLAKLDVNAHPHMLRHAPDTRWPTKAPTPG